MLDLLILALKAWQGAKHLLSAGTRLLVSLVAALCPLCRNAGH